MIRVVRERRVPVPPEEIWPLVDDPVRLGAWLAFAESIELLEGDGVGRRQRLHGRWGGRRTEVDQEVTVREPGRTLAWRHLAERLDGRPAPRFSAETRFRVDLVPDGDGTLVRLESAQEPAGILQGLLMRLGTRSDIARPMERSLAALAAQTGQSEPDAGSRR
jgi:carbon monoxide dehydrogenase subunit G